YEHTRLADGSKAIDLMDRTAGNTDWVLVKPFVTQASNCVLPAYVVSYLLDPANGGNIESQTAQLCGYAYNDMADPITGKQYVAFPGLHGGTTAAFGVPVDPTYPGFDPLAGTPGHPYTGQ